MTKSRNVLTTLVIAATLMAPGWAGADDTDAASGDDQSTQGNGATVVPDGWDLIRRLIDQASGADS